MRGSDYAELRAFAAVVEHGSFGRAAAHLNMSPSALSQTIRKLEERLDIRLLNRTTRSVAPSAAGAKLLERLLPALADLEAAVAEARALRGTPSGLLRINCTRIAAVEYLGPLVGEFLNTYPDITLDVVVEESLVDVVAGRFDAGIRLGEKLDLDMVATRISGELEMMVVAAPSYLERHGTPQTPQDLTHHRCFNFRWPTDFSLYRWEFSRDGEAFELPVEGPLITNEPEMAIPAIVAGAGIGYIFDYAAKPLIAEGNLVHLLKEWTPPFAGFYLYYPSRRQMSPALRAFVDFLHERVR